ncbi:MAG: hypothetical protein P1U47_00585 [Zhongshania sp.]|uniref:hypothetical protein n=1 Tax=Zhongshania sp. TaxID=1971902 RepID=UPI00262E697B|nr:hypothetical protein [Zhongshania sp.]MDF1690839.1 hypothetical protein [Zhongshania sp.]
MNTNAFAQRFCAVGGLIFFGILAVGWIFIAQFFPPHSPTAGAEEIAGIFSENSLMIRVGFALALLSLPFYVLFGAAIAAQLRRIEGPNEVLAQSQAACAAIVAALFMIAFFIWIGLAYRPDRPAELVLALSDIAWLILLMTTSPFIVQNITVGIAVLTDKSADPVFPRWFGFYNFWVAVLLLPAGVICLFKTGPFAWDGILGFWLPLIDFSVWVVIMTVLLFKAIKKQERAVGV